MRRQPGVHDGIAHNGAVALAQHRIGLVSPVGGVVQSAVPVVVDELRAAGQKQTVRRAVHAELDADAAFVDAVRIALNGVRGRDFHIVLPRHRGYARRGGERDRARRAVHGKAAVFRHRLPASVRLQQLCLHGRTVQRHKRHLIHLIIFCPKELLPVFWADQIGVFVFLPAAVRRARDGQRGDVCVRVHPRHGRAVVAQQRLSVRDVQFFAKFPRAAARVVCVGIHHGIALVQLCARVYQRVVPHQRVISVDSPVQRPLHLPSHALAHLPGHIADHVLAVGRAVFVRVGRAVRQIRA